MRSTGLGGGHIDEQWIRRAIGDEVHGCHGGLSISDLNPDP
ncbi:hypothetical protein [Arthrobacter sp. ISL-69]|nr:hypothetical protein [Arthrobacter sp. ISL-69]